MKDHKDFLYLPSYFFVERAESYHSLVLLVASRTEIDVYFETCDR